MPDLSKQDNEDILTVHEGDQAIEADLDAQYDPLESESGVVVLEPPIITLGRAKRAKEMRSMPDQPSQQ